MADTQIKSKDRVDEHGEVFTNEREVNAMCDFVAHECDRYDSRFLEPACGDGNFLEEVLRRKLAVLKKKCKGVSQRGNYERLSIIAVSSIYGVDIMEDNVSACRLRLFDLWNAEYKTVCKKDCTEEARDAVRYILSKNILCGNALTLMQVDNECCDTADPIIFPEWSLVRGTLIKRRDFRLDVLLKANEPAEEKVQSSMFDDDLSQYLTVNPATGEYMPLPMREYPPVPYKRITEMQ